MSEKFSPEIVKIAEDLYGYLLRFADGKRNAIKYDDLMHFVRDHSWSVLHAPTRRQVRRACKAMLRVLGKPVITCQNGVFIAETQEEIDAFVADQKSRAGELYANASAAEKVSPARSVQTGYFSFAEEKE